MGMSCTAARRPRARCFCVRWRRRSPAEPAPAGDGHLDELAGNELTFLPLAMAAAKLIASAAEGVPFSTIVTAMSRNGTDFGIGPAEPAQPGSPRLPRRSTSSSLATGQLTPA